MSKDCGCETWCMCKPTEQPTARTLYDAILEVHEAIWNSTPQPRVYMDYEVRHEAMGWEALDMREKGLHNHHVVAFAARGEFDDVCMWLRWG